MQRYSSGDNRMRLGAAGGGAVAPWPAPELWGLRPPRTDRTWMPHDKLVSKIKQERARAGLPPIAPRQDLGQNASRPGLGAWWSAVNLRESLQNSIHSGYQAASQLYARMAQNAATPAQGVQPASPGASRVSPRSAGKGARGGFCSA